MGQKSMDSTAPGSRIRQKLPGAMNIYRILLIVVIFGAPILKKEILDVKIKTLFYIIMERHVFCLLFISY